MILDLYHKCLKYRTINVYRSALSVYHNNIQGVPVGQLREVCELMSGIDNLRTPQPKYSVIWEVDLKTVKILVFAKIKRCSDLQILDNRYMVLGENKMIFKMAKKTEKLQKRVYTPTSRIQSNRRNSLSSNHYKILHRQN